MTKKFKYIAIVALLAGSIACKKTPDPVSTVVDVSYPTITLTGAEFYSIPVGGTLPVIGATAYDSLLKETYPVDLDASGLDNSTPGLYFVAMSAKNKNGYVASKNVYVAVTDVDNSANLAGKYVRTATGVEVTVSKMANGLYQTDNFFGAASTPETYAYFVHVNDSTISMPTQPTNIGELSSSDHFLTLAPGDTSFGYKLQSLTSNKVLRVFQKQ